MYGRVGLWIRPSMVADRSQWSLLARRSPTSKNQGAISGRGGPHSIEGNHVKSILRGVGSFPQVSGEPRDETASELVTKQPQTPQFLPWNAVPGLDLEADHPAVITFDDEVDFMVIASTPVAETCNFRRPRRLLDQFADRERLQEVTEFRESGWVASREFCRSETQKASREFCRSETQKASGDPGVNDVDLRERGRARRQCSAPCFESIDEENLFEQDGVVLRRRGGEPDVASRALDVEHLRGLTGEAGEQVCELLTLAQLAQLTDISLQRELRVVVEPSLSALACGSCNCQREASRTDPGDVLVARRRRDLGCHQSGGIT